MTQTIPEKKTQKRRLPAVLVGIFCLLVFLALMGFLIATFFPLEARMEEIRFDEKEYILTCRSQIDGTIDMFLYECAEQDRKSCEVVETSSVFGYPCEDLVLRAQNDIIVVKHRAGRFPLLSYAP